VGVPTATLRRWTRRYGLGPPKSNLAGTDCSPRWAAEPVGLGGFEIGYVTDDGLERRVSLSQAGPHGSSCAA
jgi:hypothetical protein